MDTCPTTLNTVEDAMAVKLIGFAEKVGSSDEGIEFLTTNILDASDENLTRASDLATKMDPTPHNLGTINNILEGNS